MLSDTGSKSLPSLRRSRTGLYESIIGGVKQGNKASAPLARGASALSRAKLWALLRDIYDPRACFANAANSLTRDQEPIDPLYEEPLVTPLLRRIREATTYEGVKRARFGEQDPIQIREEAIQDARKVLKGWIANVGDESWGLEVLIDPKKRKR